MTTQTPSASSTPVTDAAWAALAGAYDLQVHVAPDLIERRIDDLDLAREFLAHGLRGFVLKSHYIPTMERAKVVAKTVPGILAYGAITLSPSVPGWKLPRPTTCSTSANIPSVAVPPASPSTVHAGSLSDL